MTRRVKIFGCGSIGNHLSHAARRMGWDVCACDVDPAALERMEHDIYPGRYREWDSGITLHLNEDAPNGGFDLIFIGTPPQYHVGLAMKALEERPGAIIVEKPVCPPELTDADELLAKSEELGIRIFVGYDHVVGSATRVVEDHLHEGTLGVLQTLDVEFREHWEGIFSAHPWLDGPSDSYLGHWILGGGASGEHSHAMNLWQHFAHVADAGRIIEISGDLQYETDNGGCYDFLCAMTVRTESDLLGRVIQDVISRPAKKRAYLQGTEGRVEWICGYSGSSDAVIVHLPGKDPDMTIIDKSRPDDFIEEMKVLDAYLLDGLVPDGITLERGLDTMLVVAAAHRAEEERQRMSIDYTKGYGPSSISPVGLA